MRADPFLAWLRKANRLVAHIEMLGLLSETMLLTLDPLLEEMQMIAFEKSQSPKELLLRVRIGMLKRAPDYPVNQVMYQIAFRNFYPGALYRPFVIQEAEQILPSILNIKRPSDAFTEFSLYWPDDPTQPIAMALTDLAVAYEGEYMFADAIRVVGYLSERGLLDWASSPETLFWKAGKVDEGIEFFQMYHELGTKIGLPTRADTSAKNLEALRGRTYKPRPRKATSTPLPALLRYRPDQM